jgi:8-oxo-dGTP pyrophosphatase MutT (NUDIX family)
VTGEAPLLHKVVAYIVRDASLVVFTHADDHDPIVESGLQVPAGTRRDTESGPEAVLREAREETGLDGLTVVRFLGGSRYDMRPYAPSVHAREFYQLGAEGDVPEEWQHVERDGGHGEPRPFNLRWLPIKQAHVLAAGQGAMLGRIDRA